MPQQVLRACTVVANNYLPRARVFAESFRAHHPAAEVVCLLADRRGETERAEPLEIIEAESSGMPNFRNRAFRYSLLELSTSVKPWLLMHLHRQRGWDRVCYFDPDILVTAGLEDVYALLDDHDLVLTPHMTSPRRNGGGPSEREILLTGQYNLGFLGVAFNERTLAFLEWWHRHLEFECLHAVGRGLFVDQRWMDFAPLFLERAHVSRDPGLNVAYWNLAERDLKRTQQGYRVGDRPLRFFHFSGFDPRDGKLTRFETYHAAADHPDVRHLLEDYSQRLQRAGQDELCGVPNAYTRFGNGLEIPKLVRPLLQQADPHALRWADPFADGEDSFLQWLIDCDDPKQAVFVPRIAFAAWERRWDLRAAFANPAGRDRAAFADWLARYPEEVPLAELWVGQRRQPAVPALNKPESLLTAEPELRDAIVCLLQMRRELHLEDLTSEQIDSLNQAADGAPEKQPRITFLALLIRTQRADLQRTFPEPLGADRAPFASWFVANARREYALPDRFVHIMRARPERGGARFWQRRIRLARRGSPSPRRGCQPAPPANEAVKAARPRRARGPRGVNVVGWAAANTEIGEACRSVLHALKTAHIPTALWSLGNGYSDDLTHGAAGGLGGDGLPFETTILQVNGDMIEAVAAALPRFLWEGRHRIGYWFWEISSLPPQMAAATRHLAALWAPSRFCEEAFRRVVNVPVTWMPLAVSAPAHRPCGKESLGLPRDRFLFFNAFDAASVPERKNPMGLLAAFARVAKRLPGECHLVLKVNNADAVRGLTDELVSAAAQLPVTLRLEHASRSEMEALLAVCDAYVSLHRSEALGLALIEAMYLGKPVIATGYGGVCDFFDASTGWVVAHRETRLERTLPPYPKGSLWAEPDVDSAAAAMLAVFAGGDEVTLRTRAAHRRVDALYAPQRVADRICAHLAPVLTE